MSILKDRLTRFFEEEGSIGDLREGMRYIQRSGVYEILRRIGTPNVIKDGESLEVMAGQAHYAAGYQAALDHLLYFEELFGSQVNVKPLAPPDFGGTEEAIRLGHLRPSDLKE